MAKFRKKPVIIEALQLRWDTWSEMCEFVPITSDSIHGEMSPDGHLELLIPTLEGVMRAHEGDWIIKGVNGEFYPCKPDIFEKTYDPVSEM